MLRRGSAAAAYNSYAVVLHEMLVILGQLLRSELVNRMSAHILRKSGIGQHRYILRGIRSQEADTVIHLGRSSSAVQTDDVYIVGFERGQSRANFSSQQHRSSSFERHLNCDRQPLAGFLHGIEHAGQSSFGLQQVLRGFDQQNIHATFDQRARLLNIARDHVVELDMSQRRQLGRRPNRSRHKPWSVLGRELLRHLFRDLGGGNIELGNFILQVVFGQHHARPTERVRLHYIAAHAKKAGVNVFNNVRPAQDQKLVASLFAPEIVHTGIAGLYARAHRAIIDDDALLHGL